MMKAVLVGGLVPAGVAVWVSACSGSAAISESPRPVDDAGVTDAPAGLDAVVGEDGAPDVPDDATAPPRPPWHPPFDLSDDVGWHTSHETFCNALPGPSTAAVFADSRGVFVFTAVKNNELAGDTGPSGYHLYLNDGTGWKPRLSQVGDLSQVAVVPTRLSAIPGGTLFMVLQEVAAWVSPDGQDYDVVQGDARDTSATGQLGYTLFADHVAVHDGAQWTDALPLPAELKNPQRMFALDNFFVVAGLNQRVAIFDQAFELQDAVPAGDYVAAWAFARDDIWLGNYVGQLVHFDGKQWSTIAMAKEGEAIGGLWGDGSGRLYFYTASSFGYFEGSTVQYIATWPPNGSSVQFGGIWGDRATGEVYLSVIDYEFSSYACGGSFMVWFDGLALHQF